MASILVVCSGNICRSPVAEGMLRRVLGERFGPAAFDVSSAGTIGWEGSPATEESVRAAAERGLDIAGHRARRLAPGMASSADLTVTMAAEHREHIDRTDPAGSPTTFTLKELARLLESLPAGTGDPDSLAERVAGADAARTDGVAVNPDDEDVVDPLGMSMETYRAIAWEIEEWTNRLVTGLFGPVSVLETAP